MSINPSPKKNAGGPERFPGLDATEQITRKAAIWLAFVSVFIFFLKLLFF